MTAADGPLIALEAEVRSLGGLLGEAASSPAPGATAPLGAAAAHGARAAGEAEAYALLVEAIHEGYLQHYSSGRVVRAADPDLGLLAGDRLYALGLAKLAALDDLEAVAELADVISLSAQAHAEDRPGIVAAVWRAGALAVGAGTTPEHEAEKEAWRDGGGGV